MDGASEQDRRARRPFLWPVARFAVNLLLIAAAIGLILWLAGQLTLVLVPTLIALLVATLLVPPVEKLRSYGWPSALATSAVMLLAGGVLSGIIALLGPAFAEQFGDLGTTAQEGLNEVTRYLIEGPFGINRTELDEAVDETLASVGDNAGQIGQGVLSGATLLAEVVSGLLLCIVLVFFFVHDGGRMWRWIVSLVPERHREVVGGAGVEAWSTTTAYVRGVAVIAVVDAVLIGIALVVIGVPLVLPLMLLVFIGAFVPLVGAVVAGAVAALVALVSEGVAAAILVVVAITAIQQVEGDLLYPNIVGRAIKLHGAAILLVLAAGTVIAGLVGALLAVPVAAAIWTAVDYVRDSRRPISDDSPTPPVAGSGASST